MKSLRGTRQKDPWGRLLEENGSLDVLLTRLTHEFSGGFNSREDVQLSQLLPQTWSLQVSPASVFNQLSHLSNRKATGPDLVPPRLLKVGAEYLCLPLSMIFNRSIETGIYPSIFKHAHVCPVPKISNPSVSDFRPISILSSISKVFERIVLLSIRSQLIQCYGTHQHAYRPMSSTTTALVEICDNVTRGLELSDTSHVNIFCLDLSKAFDKLQHNRLVNFLKDRGLNHGFLRWLFSYLQERSFSVKVCNRFGPITTSRSGVPQGSVLGPFLFAAFMGSIELDYPNVFRTLYADDVTMVEWVLRNHVSSVSLERCVSVFSQKGLSLNQSKCKRLCVRRSNNDLPDYNCDFITVENLKVLGFTFCDLFKWNAQISNILRLASQRLHLIRCLKNAISTHELIHIYHAVVTSLFLYASPAYGQLPATLRNKLERFQSRAHRIICGCSCNCDRFPDMCSRLESTAKRLLQVAEEHEDHPLHHLVPVRLPASNKLRLPACRTVRRLNSFLPWASRLTNADS